MRVYGSNIPEGVTVVGAPVGNVSPLAGYSTNSNSRCKYRSSICDVTVADQDGSLANPFTTVKLQLQRRIHSRHSNNSDRGERGNEVSSGLVANSSLAESHHYYVGKDDRGRFWRRRDIYSRWRYCNDREGASFRMRRSIVEVEVLHHFLVIVVQVPVCRFLCPE